MDDISQLVDSARAYRIQETPYFKRLRMREESDLRHLREAQEIVQQSAKDFLELQLRRIRLNKLYNDIHQNIEKTSLDNKTKGQQRIQKVFSTFDEIRRSRISMARKRGNEFSRQNRSHLEIIHKDESKLLNKKYDNVFIKRKMYGQQVSKFNLRKLQKYKQYPNNLNDGMNPVKRTKKDDYGIYYTLRNRLNYKDTLGEYDDEYTDLLMKCVSFEKEHLDVCGFLEEKLKSNYGDINKIISKVTNKSENDCLPTILDEAISSTLSTPSSKHEDETELDNTSLHTEISNKTGTLHSNTGKRFNDQNFQSNQTTRNDRPVIKNKQYLQDIMNNNSDLFTSETVLQTNRYLNSVEEENEIDEDSKCNTNDENDNNIDINNVNDEVVLEDSDGVNDESIPTIYESQHSIHEKLIIQPTCQSELNLDLCTNSIVNLNGEAETYRHISTKSSELDESVLSSSEQSVREINDLTDENKIVDNDYVDYDNISEKSRRFEEELEALRYTEEDIENISKYVIKNNFVLEDVISDMIENSRIDGTPLNFYKLLSNIYLAYGMNLIKSSVDEKHIDLNIIKSAAEKQNASMSHALHVIFSSR